MQVITLNDLGGDEGFLRDLIFCIFENCANLRQLQLRTNYDPTGKRIPTWSLPYRTDSEFARFFAYLAKLESLVVNFDIELDFERDERFVASLPSPHFAMERLQLDQSKRSELFARLVLERCSKLKYLKVAILSDGMLQEIFKNVSSYALFSLFLDYLAKYAFLGKISGYRKYFA